MADGESWGVGEGETDSAVLVVLGSFYPRHVISLTACQLVPTPTLASQNASASGM